MKVVNIRNEKYEVYIGRGSIFGNKYVIGKDGDRELVIKKFKVDFWNKVKNDKKFLEEVLKLEGKVLGCFCFPLVCHGDVIISFINWYKKEGVK